MQFGRQSITDRDAEAVKEALTGDFLTAGPMVSSFERALTQITGAKFAVVCSSGTAALHLACLALDIGPSDLGVTSPITFVASANCLEYCGASTDFVDVDQGSICIDPELLRRYCELRRPKVVIAVDFAGIPAPWVALRALADEFGFILIADCAHSIGSTFSVGDRSYSCGGCEFADVSVLSFHPLKNITTGEGGAVLSNNPRVADRLVRLRSHGLVRDPSAMETCDGPWAYELGELGFNYRLTDFQCALGLSQIERLPEFKAIRRELVATYFRELKDCPQVRLIDVPVATDPCFHIFPIRLVEGSQRRLQVYNALKERGILTQVHYIPVHTQRYYRRKYGYGLGKCPQAEAYYAGCLSLPLHVGLRPTDITHVCNQLKVVVDN